MAGQCGEPGLTPLPGCAGEHPAVDVEDSGVPSAVRASDSNGWWSLDVYQHSFGQDDVAAQAQEQAGSRGWQLSYHRGLSADVMADVRGEPLALVNPEPRVHPPLASPRLNGCQAGREASRSGEQEAKGDRVRRTAQ